VWEDPQHAQDLGKRRVQYETVVNTILSTQQGIDESKELLELAELEQDQLTVDVVIKDLDDLEAKVAHLEFCRMFSGEMDDSNAFVDIQSGSGGTEAQDWAEMLLRMYLRWGEEKGFKVELIEVSAGEVAGIKSATIKFNGEYAFGWLRTETGVHRLVRKSPLILVTEDIPHLLQFLFPQKWMMILI